MATRCLFKSLMTCTKVTSPFPMYSRASTISPCPSFFSPTCSTDFSLAHGSCVLLLFLGASSDPSTVAPPDTLLPDAHSSSSSSRFHFDADFIIAHSFSNSGRKHVCFLLTHLVHTTPGGARINTVPSTASCFHFFTRASSTKQVAWQDMHSLHHMLPVLSTNTLSLFFFFPGDAAPSSTSMVSSGSRGCSPHLLRDGHSSCFLPAPDT